MRKLTIHVLDTISGTSANGLKIEVFRADSPQEPLASAITNVNGRTTTPLLENKAFLPGQYRLQFHVGDYFANRGVDLPQPRFINVVQVDIGVGELGNYHIPLLITPWSYSVYRGS